MRKKKVPIEADQPTVSEAKALAEKALEKRKRADQLAAESAKIGSTSSYNRFRVLYNDRLPLAEHRFRWKAGAAPIQKVEKERFALLLLRAPTFYIDK